MFLVETDNVSTSPFSNVIPFNVTSELFTLFSIICSYSPLIVTFIEGIALLIVNKTGSFVESG